jgi:hypothetical protein
MISATPKLRQSQYCRPNDRLGRKAICVARRSVLDCAL